MTTTAIIIVTLCVILATGYATWLCFIKEPQLTTEESVKLNTDKEWWKVD